MGAFTARTLWTMRLQTRYALFWVFMCGSLALFGLGCYRPSPLSLHPWASSQAIQRTTRALPQCTHLRYKDAVFHALHHNVQLRRMRATQRLKWVATQHIHPVANPELRIQGLSSALTQGKVDDLSVRLRWKPPFPTHHAAQHDQAYAQMMTHFQALRAAQFQTLYKARSLVVRLYTAQRLQALERRCSHWQKKRLQHEQKRNQVGLSSALYVAQLKLKWLQGQTQLHNQMHTIRQLHTQLRWILGVRGRCTLHPGFALKSLSAPTRLSSSALSKILHRSPEIRRLQFKYRITQARLWLAYSRRIPWFSFLQFSYGWDKSRWERGFALGLGIQLPIFDWNTRAIQVHKAHIQTLQKHIQLETIQILTQLRMAAQTHTRAYRRLQHTQKQLRKPLEAIRRLLAQTQTQHDVQPTAIWTLKERVLRLQMEVLRLRQKAYLAQLHFEWRAALPIWKSMQLQVPSAKQLHRF